MSADTELILERFREAEEEAAAPTSPLCAVRSGQRIVFQAGRQHARSVGIGCWILSLGAAGTCALGAHQLLPGVLAWVVTLVMTTLVVGLLWSSRHTFEPGVHFELDAADRALILHRLEPEPAELTEVPAFRLVAEDVDARWPEVGETRRVRLEEVDSFLAMRQRVVDDEESFIYAVAPGGRLTKLTSNLGGAEWALVENTRLLGYLCDRPAYLWGRDDVKVRLRWGADADAS
jgi:hypothetical protein